MKKNLYYTLVDLDGSQITMELSGCMEWIEGDMENKTEQECMDDDLKYQIIPTWMTEEEFNNLPEFVG